MLDAARPSPVRPRVAGSLAPALVVLTLGVSLCLSLGLAQAQATVETILPGYWEYKSSALGQDKVERRCIRQEEIARFMASPGTRRYQCEYPEQSVGGGRARYRGVCVSKHGARYPVTLKGTYTPTTLFLQGTAQPFPSVPMSIPASIDAHRISPECPQP